MKRYLYNLYNYLYNLYIFYIYYWNRLDFGSVETDFPEVAACVSRKLATVGVWEGRFCWIWVKILLFLKYKNGRVGPKILLFNYGNNLVLGSVETYFLKVGAYVSQKRAIIGVRQGRFCWIWVKTSLFL